MQFEEDTDRTEEFLSLVHKYTDIQELTPAIVNEFVDKELVHKIEETDGDPQSYTGQESGRISGGDH